MGFSIPNPKTWTYQASAYQTYVQPVREVSGKLDNMFGVNLLPVTVEGHLFHDVYIKLADSVQHTYSSSSVYHLSFDVGQLYLPSSRSNASGIYTSDTQNFTVKLRNSAGGGTDEDEYQNLKNFSVKVNQSDGYVHCELLFTPNANTYDQLVFSLTRILLLNGGDLGLEWGENEALGRRMTIANVKIQEVYNLIGSLIPGLGRFKLTGPIGTFFTLDQEEIRIGKTGEYVFDLENWMPFNYFGIVPQSIDLATGEMTMLFEEII